MIITKKHLSRRTFLRGAMGATLALPMMEAMMPALTAQSKANRPSRFGVVYQPCGIFPDTWHPDAVGSGFTFKPAMQPMEPHRAYLTTISNMTAPWGESVHVGASTAFLNGVGPAGDRDGTGDMFGKIQSKKTLDQFIADKVAEDTPLRSIEVGTEDMGTSVGACDGFPCTFFNTLAWRTDTAPLPVVINPRVTFERMFGEAGSSEERMARLKERQSILDSVSAEATRLKGKLGAPDRRIFDEYLSNIRDVEQQLDRMEKRLGTLTGIPDAPVGLPEAFDDHLSITYNLMHLALQGDITRVFTFMLGHEPTDRSYPFLGIPETHHSVSHHGNDAEKMQKYAKIATYQMSKLSEFVEKLKTTPDGDGNLLDHSLFLYGSGMTNGNQHDHENLPTLLVGGAAGKHKGNRHIKMARSTPLSNLMISLMDKAGINTEKFGQSSGRIEI